MKPYWSNTFDAYRKSLGGKSLERILLFVCTEKHFISSSHVPNLKSFVISKPTPSYWLQKASKPYFLPLGYSHTTVFLSIEFSDIRQRVLKIFYNVKQYPFNFSMCKTSSSHQYCDSKKRLCHTSLSSHIVVAYLWCIEVS